MKVPPDPVAEKQVGAEGAANTPTVDGSRTPRAEQIAGSMGWAQNIRELVLVVSAEKGTSGQPEMKVPARLWLSPPGSTTLPLKLYVVDSARTSPERARNEVAV